jgi:hypothetical protein
VVMWLVGTATVTTQGLTGSLRHDETKSGDYYLAKTGDFDLATSGDFFMATDTVTRRYVTYSHGRSKQATAVTACRMQPPGGLSGKRVLLGGRDARSRLDRLLAGVIPGDVGGEEVDAVRSRLPLWRGHSAGCCAGRRGRRGSAHLVAGPRRRVR